MVRDGIFAPISVQILIRLGHLERDTMGRERSNDATERVDSQPDGDPEESSTTDDARSVERTFTCTVCGFATTTSVGELAAEVRGICLNCGDWTLHTADLASVIEIARDVAKRVSGEVLTERQALAYLLRDHVGTSRERAADVMDTSPSNVDNLQRRGQAKVADARRLVAELDRLDAADGDVEG